MEQLFRDESVTVRDKAQRSYKTRNNSRRQLSSPSVSIMPPKRSGRPSDTPAQEVALPMAFSAPGPGLIQPVGTVALAHFMSSYVPGSHFIYLPNLYHRSGEQDPLPAAVHAASLARLAWELGQPRLMGEAKRAYAKALKKTNFALSDPAVAMTDPALVSVLLLSLYETIICAEAGTPDNWTKHTRGALALVQLRGRRQLDTQVGRALFTQVANIICVDSMRSGARLPPDLVELQKAALHYTDECPRFGMSSSTGELANLLADIKSGHLTPLGVIDATRRLEAKYIDFVSGLPAPWQFKVEKFETKRSGVYGETLHHYTSNGAARFWNSYRMTRVLLNGIVHGHARYLRPSNQSLLLETELNANRMAADICASVPQFTNPQRFAVASAAPLLWPLSTVRGADLVRADLREYAEERLKFIGRELRIPQVEKVAASREIDALQDGLHMFYLS